MTSTNPTAVQPPCELDLRELTRDTVLSWTANTIWLDTPSNDRWDTAECVHSFLGVIPVAQVESERLRSRHIHK